MTEKLAPIAVRAATKAFRVLTHQPSGEGFDADGNGLWPADQFTYRLLAEGAIERRAEEKDTTPPAKPATRATRSTAKAEPAPSIEPIAPAERAAEAALLDPTESRSHAADAPSTAE